MRCAVCGKENQNGTGYCVDCGAPLNAWDAAANHETREAGYATYEAPRMNLQLAVAGAGAEGGYATQETGYAWNGTQGNGYASFTGNGVNTMMANQGETAGIAIAGLVLGIISLCVCFIKGLGLIMGAASLIVGIIGLIICCTKHKGGKVMAGSAILMGIIAMIPTISAAMKVASYGQALENAINSYR